MKKFILASTSTVYGSNYLEYLKNQIIELFKDTNEILFIPFARPSGISHDEYTHKAKEFFNTINIKVTGLHTIENKKEAIKNAKGVFTGGGNTFLLMKQMYKYDLFPTLKTAIENGCAYLGTSAGSNISGINVKTTNDMPIVYPPSFDAMGIVPFCINPHYLDPDKNSTHKGETRETRILEFLTQNTNPVVGLREGNYINCINDNLTIEGPHSTRIFENGKTPYEVDSGTDLKQLFNYLY
ncbi:dipeptidase PepE [Weeksellaceae bacterium TAE3-ERU29]|nr:dipeptidase PepE [Weeksellaceae bacterium TAE3-ERU29]